MQKIVSEHEQYLDTVRDFNDWLISAKEELQRWSDLSGDSVNIRRKLSKVQVRKGKTLHFWNDLSGWRLPFLISSFIWFNEFLESLMRYKRLLCDLLDQNCVTWLFKIIGFKFAVFLQRNKAWMLKPECSSNWNTFLTSLACCQGIVLLCYIFYFFFFLQELLDSKQRGRERLNRVQRYGAVARDYTGSGGYEAMEREEATLLSSWEQWERGALQTRASLETALSQISSSEQEFSSLSAQLEQDLQDFSAQLQGCRHRLCQAEKKNDGEEAVKGWQMAKVGWPVLKMMYKIKNLRFWLSSLSHCSICRIL